MKPTRSSTFITFLLALVALCSIACSSAPAADEPDASAPATIEDYAARLRNGGLYLEPAAGDGPTKREVFALGSSAYQLDYTLLWQDEWQNYCDAIYPDSPDTLYVPIPGNGPPCTSAPQPVNGVLNGGVQCDFGTHYYSAWYEDLELDPAGDGELWMTLEEKEWGAFDCVLWFDVEVTKLY